MAFQVTTELTCPICSGVMEGVVDLPRYPLTERYEPVSKPFKDTGYAEQSLLYCQGCCHGKLKNIIDPDYLYGKEYTHRTGNSISSLRAVRSFAKFVGCPRPFTIDIGSADDSLVDELFEYREKPLEHMYSWTLVDPHASDSLFRCTFDKADLTRFKDEQKLFVSSHTLEHIPDVNAFMEKVASLWKKGDRLAISVPGLESLVFDHRFDQVHHQHVHYFSLRSLGLLLAKHGFGIVKSEVDHMHWGSLMVVADRKTSDVSSLTMHQHKVGLAYTEFRSFLRDIDCRGAIGLGAGLMAPVLKYHMPQLNDIEYIVDSDKSKHGKRYQNWDKQIKGGSIEGRKVVVIPIQTKHSCRALVAKAMDEGAREIVVPLRSL